MYFIMNEHHGFWAGAQWTSSIHAAWLFASLADLPEYLEYEGSEIFLDGAPGDENRHEYLREEAGFNPTLKAWAEFTLRTPTF